MSKKLQLTKCKAVALLNELGYTARCSQQFSGNVVIDELAGVCLVVQYDPDVNIASNQFREWLIRTNAQAGSRTPLLMFFPAGCNPILVAFARSETGAFTIATTFSTMRKMLYDSNVMAEPFMRTE